MFSTLADKFFFIILQKRAVFRSRLAAVVKERNGVQCMNSHRIILNFVSCFRQVKVKSLVTST